MFAYLSILLLLVGGASASNVQFISSVNDYEISCTLQANESTTVAGTLFGLCRSHSLTNSTNFFLCRLNTNTGSVFVLGNASFMGDVLGTTSIDPINNLVMIQHSGTTYIYSTIDGSHNATYPNMSYINSVSFAATSGLVVGYLNQKIVSFNMTSGVLKNLTSSSLTSINTASRAFDITTSTYYIMGITGGVQYLAAYANLDGTVTETLTAVSNPGLFQFTLTAADGVYVFAWTNGGRTQIAWYQIDLETGALDMLGAPQDSASFSFQDIAVDLANSKVMGALTAPYIVSVYELLDGATAETVDLFPTDLILGPIQFDPICVCCIVGQETMSTHHKLSLQSSKFSHCNALTSGASMPTVGLELLVLSTLFLFISKIF